MRHVWSLLAGIVITPLAWFAVAYGQAVMFDAAQVGGTRPLWLGLVLFAAVGLLLGLVGSLRVSPAGPLFVALSYVGATAFLIARPEAAKQALPDLVEVSGTLVVPLSPVSTGVLGLIGAMLLIAAASLQRWRSWPRPEATEPTWPEMLAPSAADRHENTLADRDSFNGFADLRTPADASGVDAPSWSAPTKV
ncbi:hypothetical protein Cci01nite_35340 [Catellatospora citrea]|uniref:Tryptophan-associated transmembrane protein n=1 Tax=Catellatospora citrea TaxID=53366 RepID=A0A8J3NZJ5_9ACTN|nr:hypothetical protein C8E86_2902 [Catellatospora citrea]GIF98440.1 hypothetical protein Cci01nite_35340 [Catellatospora citrea]